MFLLEVLEVVNEMKVVGVNVVNEGIIYVSMCIIFNLEVFIEMYYLKFCLVLDFMLSFINVMYFKWLGFLGI